MMMIFNRNQTTIQKKISSQLFWIKYCSTNLFPPVIESQTRKTGKKAFYFKKRLKKYREQNQNTNTARFDVVVGLKTVVVVVWTINVSAFSFQDEVDAKSIEAPQNAHSGIGKERK